MQRGWGYPGVGIGGLQAPFAKKRLDAVNFKGSLNFSVFSSKAGFKAKDPGMGLRFCLTAAAQGQHELSCEMP